MKNHKIPKLLFVLLIFFVNNLLKAQVNIEYTSVNEYAFTTKEALNFIATNASTKSFNAVFNGIIKDADGHPVVEFSTTETAISPGANIFTPLVLSFADIQYSNMDIAEIEMSSGTYPSGTYTLCIWMTCVSADCNGIGASYSALEPKCIPIHIENPTPLILATPENEAEIEETRPLYTWIPPAPVAGSVNLNYTMILVEMMEGQTKADALTQNRPLIAMEGIGNPALMHPSDIPELEKGKWYAWQVEAFVGKTSIAKSEQWKFKVKKEEKKKEKETFVKLKTDDRNIYTVKESLNITYIEDYIPQVLDVSIYSVDGQLVYEDKTAYQAERGENSYSILMSQFNAQINKLYELRVKTRGENYIY